MPSSNQNTTERFTSTIPVHIPKDSKELDEDYVKSLLARIKKQRDTTSTTNVATSNEKPSSLSKTVTSLFTPNKLDESLSIRDKMRGPPPNTEHHTTTNKSDNNKNLYVRLPKNSNEINEDFVKNLLSDFKHKNDQLLSSECTDAKKVTIEKSAQLKSTTTTKNVYYVRELRNTSSIDTASTNGNDKVQDKDRTESVSMKSIDDLLDKIKRDVRNWKTTATKNDEGQISEERDDAAEYNEDGGDKPFVNEMEQYFQDKDTFEDVILENRDDVDEIDNYHFGSERDGGDNLLERDEEVKATGIVESYQESNADMCESREPTETKAEEYFTTAPLTGATNTSNRIENNQFSQIKTDIVALDAAQEVNMYISAHQEDSPMSNSSWYFKTNDTPSIDYVNSYHRQVVLGSNADNCKKDEGNNSDSNENGMTNPITKESLESKNVEQLSSERQDDRLKLLSAATTTELIKKDTSSTITPLNNVNNLTSLPNPQQDQPCDSHIMKIVLSEPPPPPPPRQTKSEIENTNKEYEYYYQDVEDIWNDRKETPTDDDYQAVEDIWNTDNKKDVDDVQAVEDVWNENDREDGDDVQAVEDVWNKEGYKQDDEDIKALVAAWTSSADGDSSDEEDEYEKCKNGIPKTSQQTSKQIDDKPSIKPSEHIQQIPQLVNNNSKSQDLNRQKIIDSIPQALSTKDEKVKFNISYNKTNRGEHESVTSNTSTSYQKKKRLTLACVNSIAFEMILSENNSDDDVEEDGDDADIVPSFVGDEEEKHEEDLSILEQIATNVAMLPSSSPCVHDKGDADKIDDSNIQIDTSGESDEKVIKSEHRTTNSTNELILDTSVLPEAQQEETSIKTNNDNVEDFSENDCEQSPLEKQQYQVEEQETHEEVEEQSCSLIYTSSAEPNILVNEDVADVINSSKTTTTSENSTPIDEKVDGNKNSRLQNQDNESADIVTKDVFFDTTLPISAGEHDASPVEFHESEIDNKIDTYNEQTPENADTTVDLTIIEHDDFIQSKIETDQNCDVDTNVTDEEYCEASDHVANLPHSQAEKVFISEYVQQHENYNGSSEDYINTANDENNKSKSNVKTIDPQLKFREGCKIDVVNRNDVSNVTKTAPIDDVDRSSKNSFNFNQNFLYDNEDTVSVQVEKVEAGREGNKNNLSSSGKPSSSSLTSPSNKGVNNKSPATTQDKDLIYTNKSQLSKRELMKILSHTKSLLNKSQEEYKERNNGMNSLLHQFSTAANDIGTTNESTIVNKSTSITNANIVENSVSIAQRNVDTVGKQIEQIFSSPNKRMSMNITDRLAHQDKINCDNKNSAQQPLPKNTKSAVTRRFCPEDDDSDAEWISKNNSNKIRSRPMSSTSSTSARRPTPTSSTILKAKAGIKDVRNLNVTPVSNHTDSPTTRSPLNNIRFSTPINMRNNGTPLANNIRATVTDTRLVRSPLNNIRATTPLNNIVRNNATPTNAGTARSPINNIRSSTPINNLRNSAGIPITYTRSNETPSPNNGTPKTTPLVQSPLNKIRSTTPSSSTRNNGTPTSSETPKTRNFGTSSQKKLGNYSSIKNERPDPSRPSTQFTFSRPSTPLSRSNRSADTNDCQVLISKRSQEGGNVTSAMREGARRLSTKANVTSTNLIDPPIPTSFSCSSGEEDISVISKDASIFSSNTTSTQALRQLASQTTQRLSAEDTRSRYTNNMSIKEREQRHANMISLIEKLSKGKLSS